MLLQVEVIGIRTQAFAILFGGEEDVHDLARGRHRDGTKPLRIDQAEDRRVGTDSERQR
jgi:hypothetical protein